MEVGRGGTPDRKPDLGVETSKERSRDVHIAKGKGQNRRRQDRSEMGNMRG